MAMASVSYPSNVVSHLVQPLLFEHQPGYIPPILTKITLTIDVDLRCYDPMTGDYTTFNTNPFPSQETLCFGLDVLQSRNRIHEVLDPAFTRLGIDTSSTSYNTIVREIIGHGLIIAHMMVHRGYYCEVMYLQSAIQAVVVENEASQESRALAESMSEFENVNYGMVAAKELSIKEMLKRVRVEHGDEEKCIICLEKLKVGYEASRMPCSHSFHGSCIQRWLKQSHYCPICRFEMPTN
ncbi:hypothetical protein HRI_001047900 [Hibiscus trionum]|uniref:RING-type E3 ubiquitin transferase n=1 Tax=Hibiscus trionum TaxID=183268 RepID=A0A9W7HA82_HIBTR|nr:hypothetical protein HRI_001047900 [Hibiscus trionum]